MAVNLANDEVIVSKYEYAHVKTKGGASGANHITKSLMVTNKRIIHQISGTGFGREQISVDEMPVQSAKYVSTYYGKKSFPMFLVMGILLLIFGVVMLIMSSQQPEMPNSSGNILILPMIITFIVGIVFIIIYFVKKDYVVTCDIATEGIVMPVMGFSSRQEAKVGKRSKRIKISSKVSVDHVVAKQMAEELSSIILDVQEAKPVSAN